MQEKATKDDLCNSSKRPPGSPPPPCLQGTSSKVQRLSPPLHEHDVQQVAKPCYPENYVRGRVSESDPWIPEKLRVADFHLGVCFQFVEARRIAAKAALVRGAAAGLPPSVYLEQAVRELGLEVVWGEMASNYPGNPLVKVEMPTTQPSLLYIGNTRDHAAAKMVRYLLLVLINPPKGY